MIGRVLARIEVHSIGSNDDHSNCSFTTIDLRPCLQEEGRHELFNLMQREDQSLGDYLEKFMNIWDQWCKSLGDEIPPTMSKKDHRCMTNLKPSLKFKVELKRPTSFNDAVAIAREKEWKFYVLLSKG